LNLLISIGNDEQDFPCADQNASQRGSKMRKEFLQQKRVVCEDRKCFKTIGIQEIRNDAIGKSSVHHHHPLSSTGFVQLVLQAPLSSYLEMALYKFHRWIDI